jgi:hypothetical protein
MNNPTTNYDGTTSLAKAIAADLQLCSLNNTNKISKLTQQAATALGLPIDKTGGKKSTADNIAIFEWLKTNHVTQTTAKIEPADNLDVGETTTDLFGIDANETEPSNQNEPAIIAECTQTECFEPETDSPNLKDLAVEINLLNEQVEHHKNQAVIYAARTGEKLLLAKAKCKHGEFGNWLKENCTVSQRYANQFMRLATDMPDLISNSQTSSNLGLNQALELLSAPEEIREEVTAKIEAGEDVTIKEIQRLKKEAVDLAHEKQSILLNLAGANDEIAEKQKRINWLEIDRKGVIEQNDELRNRDQALIDAKVAEAKAQLILENQQAIAENKRIAENAIADLERLKKDRDNQIKMGVSSELQKYESEITQKTRQIEYQKQELEKMMNVKRELDSEVGTLAIHKKAIEKIKDNLSFLTVSFSDVFDTTAIPSEVTGEWDAIFYAISKLKKQMAEWRDQYTPLESMALVGELVDI